ncbi:serine/threonine-protein kinase MARK2-like [Patiria miniata]|uniref:non-specific serine/threonine protein kinase n=1 Tax=Patiria miniata TaxID=46514 RepID=A0A914A6G6_PATMI|nr:serine/threonine-protein kinase MARK2-like [Patiria miniata]
MPPPSETLVQLPHMSHVHPGLRYLYERAESGVLPTITTKTALSRSTQEKTARYPHVKRVGPYLLGKTVGEGSFAKVKEALHNVVGEKVAVKIIDKKVVREDPYLRKNMRREASLLQSLRHHPNIITLYEVMETDNNFYMILELCTGGALLDRICSEKCLLEKEARRYVRQIVSAVDHMHQAGILHRDLKVENLLLDGNDNIKIIDFGLSNLVGNGQVRAEFRATQCGSPAYAAPEIIANKRYGAKVDVWSIGVNTFAMLAGCLPFTVEPFNIKLLLKKINSREMAEIPTHLSNDCKDFIRRLLHPDPRMRYSVIDTMNHRWLAEDRGALHRPRTASPPPSGRVSRMELETDILEYIWSNMGYNINHVTNSVISKRADEYSAIYYLLLRKRDRQHRKMLKKLEAVDEGAGRDAKDSGISGPKLYDEATAMELAGRKNGSLHFKMALLLEQETEEGALKDQSSTKGQPDEETNQNDLKSSDEPMITEKNLTSSPEKNKESTVTSSKEGINPTHALHRQSRNTTHYNMEQKRSNFQSNMDALKLTNTRSKTTEKIQDDWRDASKKVTTNTSDMHVNSRTAGNGRRFSTAHTVNLTFKQSDTPSENFAGHFNYRSGESGNRKRLVLAPTRITKYAPISKVVTIPTWRQADSIDSVNLNHFMDGLHISPRNENSRGKDKDQPDEGGIRTSTQTHKDAKNTRNTRQPMPKDCEILSKRRQLKISKRKSIDNPSLSPRRPTKTRKRTSSDTKLVARLPGRPKTPVASESKAQTKRQGALTDPKRRESQDKNRGCKRKKSITKKASTPSDSDGGYVKCEEDPEGRDDSQPAPPTQAELKAASPLMKKALEKTPLPKARLTNKRIVCNAVTAETLV